MLGSSLTFNKEDDHPEKGSVIQDAVWVDSPPANKFGFTWSAGTSVHLPPSANRSAQRSPTESSSTLKPPALSRAVSMPSQLGHLQNPCRDLSSSLSPHSLAESSPELSHFFELSLELAASVQLVVQTLLQVSPAQVLDPSKEQFSACSLPVPTASISAVLTSLKSLNYMSANMASFCTQALKTPQDENKGPCFNFMCNEPNDFDIGELLQNVGDALSGAAAEAGADLVLFHGDVGIKHVLVKGDESGLAFALSHVVRQIIGTTQPSDCIEIGLFVGPVSGNAATPSDTPPDNSVDPVESDFRCTFEISHKFSTPDSGEDSPLPSRSRPMIESILLQRLLDHLGASLTLDLEQTLPGHRACELTVILRQGSVLPSTIPPRSFPDATSTTSSDIRIADEPTLEELMQLVESLKGKKAMLHASSKGSFAHHLTSYLTAWGLDVSHVSRECNDRPGLSPVTEFVADPPAGKADFSAYGIGSDSPPRTSSENVEEPSQGLHSQSFVLIDDDIAVLRERLNTFHMEQPQPFNFNLRRQSLTPSHRPRLSPQGHRPTGQPRSFDTLPSVVIMHFTSLANFKLIKDVVQSHPGSPFNLPEIMIIPKPVGPRRFLTALHTAVTKPTVDPYFSPIATSPTSPSLPGGTPFLYSNANLPKSPTNRPMGSRSNSDRSVRSPKDTIAEHAGLLPPSPLGIADGKDYFQEKAVQLGNTPSSGLVIQSPDGQPAGIVFHPRAKGSRKPSFNVITEQERSQLFVPTVHRRVSSPRRPSDNDSAQGIVNILGVLAATPPGRPRQATDIHQSEEDLSSSPTRGAKGRRLSSDEPPSSSSSKIASPSIPGRVATPSAAPSAERAASPSASPRKVILRRSTFDRAPSYSSGSVRKGKSPGDANVVPPISVLIVDDNPINQTILSTFMKKKQIKYDVAKNGQEAVQKWRTGGFHLILMDIQMPIMDGIQATKEIRRLEKENANAGYPPLTPQSDIQQTLGQPPAEVSQHEARLSSPYRSSVIIVALTASSLQSDRVAALAAGCNDFLTKPVSLIWLNNKITEWGSIKALQMWGDVRPDVVKSVSSGQDANARGIAERLHLPPRGTSPSPSRLSSNVPSSDTTASPPPNFWSPTQSPATFWNQPNLAKIGSMTPIMSSEPPLNETDASNDDKEVILERSTAPAAKVEDEPY